MQGSRNIHAVEMGDTCKCHTDGPLGLYADFRLLPMTHSLKHDYKMQCVRLTHL